MKTLSERIAERVGIKPSSASHSNRAVVMELRDDIQQAIADGWSVLSIYQTLRGEGQVTFSYQAFRRHVNRLLLGKTEIKKRHPTQPQRPAAVSSVTPMRGFTFDAMPKDEDLF